MGRLWSDQVDDDIVEDSLENNTPDISGVNKYLLDASDQVHNNNDKTDSSFTVVLSKSQKKKLRKKAIQAQKNDKQKTRNRAGPQNYA